MISSYFKYWGKARPSKDLVSASYHLLVYHCLDVAAVARELILYYKPCEQVIKQFAISKEVFADIFAFFTCLHDLGKFSTAFQSLVPNLSDNLVKADHSKKYDPRHDSLGYFLWKKELQRSWFASENFCLSGEKNQGAKNIFEIIINTVTGHHGVPPQFFDNRSLNLHFSEADISAAFEFLIDVSNLFLIQPWPDCFINSDFKKIWKRNSWFFNGITVLADWLGSDQEIFPYQSEPGENLLEYWQNAQLKAKHASIKIGLKLNNQPMTYTDSRYLFPKIELLSPLQQACAEIKLSIGPQLFILEDVTGSGKTEAALLLAHRLMSDGAAEGIYIGLPTMATANGMYSRLEHVYKKLFCPDSSPSLILSHSKSRLSESFAQSLSFLPQPQFADKNYDKKEHTASSWCNQWFSDNRKKALLADIGVGTLDQALLGILPAKHQSLRLLGLTGKILIADEIHAYDHYTGELLSALVEAHSQQGGSTILLSATMTRQLKDKLFDAFYKGRGTQSINENKSKSEAFPLLTHISENTYLEVPIAAREISKRSVKVKFLSNKESIYEKISEAINSGKCVCWIRNTVNDAIDSLKELSELPGIKADKIMLFHSRFAMKDRLKIEAKVNEYFGDSSNSEIRAGRVLIATQVVEQSLDLDFDLLISDLAPIDLLIQRAGRLHRHLRDARGSRLLSKHVISDRGQPVFYVFAPEPEDNPDDNWLQLFPGTQAVYPDVSMLWLTQQILLDKGFINMPEMARSLIEGVFSNENKFKPIPKALEKFSNNAHGKGMADQDYARLNILNLRGGYCWESADNDGWDKDIETPTRLGEDSHEVILAIFDGENILPYCSDSTFPWDMSSLSLDKKRLKGVAEKILQSLQVKIKQLIEATPQLKNYSFILPLSFNASSQLYEACLEGDARRLTYCPKIGFQLN